MRENYNTVIPPTLLVCLLPPKRAVNGIAQYSHEAETGKTKPAHLQSKTHHQTQGVLGRLEKIQTQNLDLYQNTTAERTGGPGVWLRGKSLSLCYTGHHELQ